MPHNAVFNRHVRATWVLSNSFFSLFFNNSLFSRYAGQLTNGPSSPSLPQRTPAPRKTSCPGRLSRFLIGLRNIPTKLYEASWRHREHLLLRQTHFANPLKLRTLQDAKEYSRCSSMFLISQIGLPRDADVKSLSEPTDHGTRQHAIFISLCSFDHSMQGVNVKYIYQCGGGEQLIVGSPNQKYTNRPR